MSSVLFAVVGGVLAICAVALWIKDRKREAEPDVPSPEEALATWIHQCRSDGNGRLVAAVCDTSLQTSHRVEALREVISEFTNLGLPSQYDAYKLLSAREDVDRALRAGVQDNDPRLIRTSLLALQKYEISGHEKSVQSLVQRILTNPSKMSETLRVLALRYLSEHGSKASQSLMIDIMEMGTVEDRAAAIPGLQRFGTALAVPALHATAADPTMASLRGEALAAVGAIQARIGPVDNGLLSLSEQAGRVSMIESGGYLSSTDASQGRAL